MHAPNRNGAAGPNPLHAPTPCHNAPAIIEADGYGTVYDMLDGKYIDGQVEYRFSKWKLFTPIVLASYGVKRTFEGEPACVTVKLDTPIQVGPQEIDQFLIRYFHFVAEELRVLP